MRLICIVLALLLISTNGNDADDGLVGVFTQNFISGSLEVWLNDGTAWTSYVSYNPSYPQAFLLITTQKEDTFLGLNQWLIIGSSSGNGNPTGFAIYNTSANTTQNHPNMRATGLIMDAIWHAASQQYFIVGNLGVTGQGGSNLGLLATCSPYSGCSEASGIPPIGPLIYASFYQCNGTILVSMQSINTFFRQIWKWSANTVASGWILVTSYIPPLNGDNLDDLEFTCVNNQLYGVFIGGYSDVILNDTILCNKSLTPISPGWFAIVQILWNGTCTAVMQAPDRIVLGTSSSRSNHLTYAIKKGSDWTMSAWNGSDVSNVAFPNAPNEIWFLSYNEERFWAFVANKGWAVYSNSTWNFVACYCTFIFQVENSTLLIGGVTNTEVVIISHWDPVSNVTSPCYTLILYGPILPVLPIYNGSYIVSSGYNVYLGAYYGVLMTEFLETDSDTGKMPVLSGQVAPPAWNRPSLIPFVWNDTVMATDSDGMTFYDGEISMKLRFPHGYQPWMFYAYFYGDMGWTMALNASSTWTFCNWNMTNPNMTCWNSTCPSTDQLSIFNSGSGNYPSMSQLQPYNICRVSTPDRTMSFPPPFTGLVSSIIPGPNDTLLFSGQFISEGYPTLVVRLESDLKTHTNLWGLTSLNNEYVVSIWVFGDDIYAVRENYALFQYDYFQEQFVKVPKLENLHAISMSGGVKVGSLPFSLATSTPASKTMLYIFLCVGLGFIFLVISASTFVIIRRLTRKKNAVERSRLLESMESRSSQPVGSMSTKFDQNVKSKNRHLAKGAFGHVTSVRHTNGGLYAAKYIKLSSPAVRRLALQEIEILKMLEHANTIRLQDYSLSDEEAVLYTDLFDGSVMDICEKRRLDRDEVLIIADGMGKAIRYIHSVGIAHRDIKLANVLIDLSGHDRISSAHVADFGLAILVPEDGMALVQLVGSRGYIAPEIKQALKADKDVRSTMKYDPFAADVYSFGVCLWEMCDAKEHFLMRKDNNVPMTLDEEMEPMRKIIEGCRRKDVSRRWSIDKVLEHLHRIK